MKKKLQKYEEKEKLDSDNHQQQLTAMKEKLSEYKEQRNREREMFEAKIYDVLNKVFTPGQIRSLLNPSKKRVIWSPEDIASAMSLRSVSPKAYRYLRNVIKTPLPALSTLRRWASNISTEPGIINAVLHCMKVKGKSMENFEKLVVVTFDEVYLSNKVGIDRKIQKVIGPHKTCQCVMVRSLFANWKQPIYYDYDKAMKKDTLETIISQLYHVGYTVVAIACDMGSSNMALWSELNIEVPPKNCHFPHPVDHSLQVFAFADVPHLLKLARNHLLDNGFTVCGQRIDKKCLQRIVDINTKDIKVSYSLTQYHLDVQGTERQKVLPAVQVFSERVAKAIEWYGLKGYMDKLDWTESARVIKLFNNWFDIFNASSMYGQHEGKNAYGINVERQNCILDEMNTLMNEIKIGNHKSLIAFQKGIMVNNSSLRKMLPYIQEKYSNSKFKIMYILTRRLD
ncbi:uncharacterized protein LOC105198981 isoform X1 [Solenopsis invicta]|uniref:uncharacterized protein LOC105198981 isoform X1 n=1 Tax=Solenopsis invicta TaxID=13686 RepID=UPI00193CFDF4|nr:uncharacterized protein LOC105198981 isoform X1 [Solenopsis invicta]